MNEKKKFNPGDKVRRTVRSWNGCEEGEIYTVSQQVYDSLELEEFPEKTFVSQYFELVKPRKKDYLSIIIEEINRELDG